METKFKCCNQQLQQNIQNHKLVQNKTKKKQENTENSPAAFVVEVKYKCDKNQITFIEMQHESKLTDFLPLKFIDFRSKH